MYTLLYISHGGRICHRRNFEMLADFLECIRLDRLDGYNVTINGNTAIAK